MINWPKLQQDFKNVLGRDAVSVDPDGKQAMLLEDKSPIAIFRINKDDSLDVHLRASITPNYAALIACVAVYSHQLEFGENFEFGEKGEWLFGESALKFFNAHADQLWRPTIGQKPDEVSVKKNTPANLKLN